MLERAAFAKLTCVAVQGACTARRDAATSIVNSLPSLLKKILVHGRTRPSQSYLAASHSQNPTVVAVGACVRYLKKEERRKKKG